MIASGIALVENPYYFLPPYGAHAAGTCNTEHATLARDCWQEAAGKRLLARNMFSMQGVAANQLVITTRSTNIDKQIYGWVGAPCQGDTVHLNMSHGEASLSIVPVEGWRSLEPFFCGRVTRS